MKEILNVLAQAFLIIGVVFYWKESATLLNPVAIALILLLVAELLSKNLIVTFLTSTVIGLLSLYMILAVVSEYRDFPIGDKEGVRLLYIGISLFVSSLVLSVLMTARRLFYTN